MWPHVLYSETLHLNFKLRRVQLDLMSEATTKRAERGLDSETNSESRPTKRAKLSTEPETIPENTNTNNIDSDEEDSAVENVPEETRPSDLYLDTVGEALFSVYRLC